MELIERSEEKAYPRIEKMLARIRAIIVAHQAIPSLPNTIPTKMTHDTQLSPTPSSTTCKDGSSSALSSAAVGSRIPDDPSVEFESIESLRWGPGSVTNNAER